jgi:monomeric sarcosine oxidase
MSMARRQFVQSLAGAAAQKTCDAAVIGAGVFGAWTAWHLQRAGQSVLLLDAYGAGHARASSGGESRIIRMGYGPDELYTRWSNRSLSLWREFFQRLGRPELFQQTGVLWMARDQDPYTTASQQTLQKAGVRFEKLHRAELDQRFPQISFGPVSWALFEPESGALLARRAVQAVVEDFVRLGGEYRIEAATAGTRLAGTTVYACGPWLPKLFPELLRDRIHPTRQEVYFFGVPKGDRRFAPPALPAWIDFGDEVYGIPDLENRGFKIALDRHGPAIDPDAADRTVTPATLVAVRRFLARRFPALKNAPLVEARVCQYENTSKGDFLIDRHPAHDNVWLIGGGSGHGFKHGPALGEYVAERITQGGPVEGRFRLATKAKVQRRAIY